MSGHLVDQVALVAGSSRGIGRAVAHALAAEGAYVVVNGRDAAAVEDTVASVRAAGGSVAGVVGTAAAPGTA